jgi:hypothetical protein
MDTNFYLEKITKERKFQDEKWGEQDHHPLLWFSIIGEEYGEMLKAYNDYSLSPDRNFAYINTMKREAVQVAASCVAMLECLDRVAEKGMVP